MAIKTLFSFELEPGMIVADDIRSTAGHLIVEKNEALTSETINLIKVNNIMDIKIDDTPVTSGFSEDSQALLSASMQELTKTERFNNFKNNFFDGIQFFQNSLNEVVSKNTPIDTASLSDTCNDIIQKTGPGLELFSMLHCMREFNDSTFNHSLNVALIASMLGKWLDFNQADIDMLMVCGILHDIGKLTVPDNILNKPGKLTPEEYEIMKKHTIDGYNILKPQKIDTRIKEAALFHHERYDGKGYPLGVAGEKIPKLARVVAIADVYDAMTAKRCYHAPFCPFKVIELMEQDSYDKYDPFFIKTFLSNVADTYINNQARLSDGRNCEIIINNPVKYSRPLVKCGSEFIDLSKNSNLYIDALL